MNPVNTLYYCLRAVTLAAGNEGNDPTTRDRTRAYLKAYAEHYVPHSISIPVAGEELVQFFGVGFEIGDDTARDILATAVRLGREEGWKEVAFEMPLSSSTALGTMAAAMYHQNGGGL